MEILNWTLYYVTRKYLEYMRYYMMMLLELCDHILAKDQYVTWLGYCYMIARGPYSCLLGHVAGLLFCLFVKMFLPSIFNSVDFSNSMSLIVLDIELTKKNIFEELGLFLMDLYKDFHFVHQKLLNLMKRQHVVVESWIMRSYLLSFTT